MNECNRELTQMNANMGKTPESVCFGRSSRLFAFIRG
jgi:hypothetical protein